jgi:outer membrane protein assembly factor BamB
LRVLRAVLCGLPVVGSVLLSLAPAMPGQAAAQPWRQWRTQAGVMTLVLVGDAASALVGETAPEPTTGRPQSRLVRVEASSARAVWARAYRNSNCCGLPAVGWLGRSGLAFAAGDELVLVTLGGEVVARLDLGGTTLDAAAAGGRMLVGVVRVRPGAVAHELVAVEAGRVLWRVGFPQVVAVALSSEGLAAAASLAAVAVLDGQTGQVRWRLPLEEGRLVDLAFAPGARLVVAQKTAAGTLRVLAVDGRTGAHRWTVSLGPTVAPAVAVVEGHIVVSDARGRLAALISAAGAVQQRWTDAQGPVFVARSPQGEVAVATGADVVVQRPDGAVRWRGTVPGSIYGLRLDGPWLAAIGTVAGDAQVPDRVWFARTDRASAVR